MGFKKAFKAELFKIYKKKYLRQLTIISIALFLIIMLVVEITHINNKNIRSGKQVDLSSNIMSILEKYETLDYDVAIQIIEQQQTQLKQEINKTNNIIIKSNLKKKVQQNEKELILFKYLVGKNIKPQDAKIYTSDVSPAVGLITQIIASNSGENSTIINIKFIVQLILNLLGQILLFYIIVMVANSYTKELDTGEMRLVAIRPIKRNTILTAKLSAILSSVFILVSSIYLLSLVYGLTFNHNIGTALTVIGDKVVNISPSVSLLLPFVSFMASAVFVTFMTACIATFCKQSNKVLVLSFIVMILGPIFSIILGLVGASFMELTVAMNFINSLTFNQAMFGGSGEIDIYSGLIVYLVYLFVFIVVAYYRHSKKDIA